MTVGARIHLGLAPLVLLVGCAAPVSEGGESSGSTSSDATVGTDPTTAHGTSAPTTAEVGESVDPDGSSDADGSSSPSSGTSEGDTTEAGWSLVWADEFDGDAIDPARWQHEVNCWGGGNGEQQCYTASPSNAFVADGALHIVARAESTSGPAVNDDDPGYDPSDTSVTLPYSSARLRTRGMGDWRFGRVEVRARLPHGQGTWTGVWMLPTELVYGGWAASGEIDIMEAVNLGVEGEQRVYGTLHYGSYWPANVHTGAEYTLPGGASPADDFHDYALEWERGEIRWYVDGFHYATQQDSGWYTQYDDGSGNLVVGEGAAPFDEVFHLILNLAVGGAWAGNVNAGGIDAAVFPQELTVEYVRVFECSASPESGDGCDTIGDDFQLVPGIDPPP